MTDNEKVISHEHNALLSIAIIGESSSPPAERKRALWDIQVACKRLRDQIILEEREEREGKR